MHFHLGNVHMDMHLGNVPCLLARLHRLTRCYVIPEKEGWKVIPDPVENQPGYCWASSGFLILTAQQLIYCQKCNYVLIN